GPARTLVAEGLSNSSYLEKAIYSIGLVPTDDFSLLLMDHAHEHLIETIDTAIKESAEGMELSEVMASAGVLPLYGFPTNVKPLYTSKPSRETLSGDMSREDRVAISEYSPGSELVKDKSVHVVVGIGRFMPVGGTIHSTK